MQALLRRVERILSPTECLFMSNIPFQRQSLPKCMPSLPIELWLDIFQFATYVHHAASIRPLDPFLPRRTSNNAMAANTPIISIRTKKSLVLVCKPWKAVAERFLYEHLVISSPARANAILAVLLGSRSSSFSSSPGNVDIGYGRWPTHIEIFTHARGTNDIRFLQTLFRIFQCCPNVKFLSGSWSHPLPIEFLHAVARLYGSSLQGLYWNNMKNVDELPSMASSTTFIGSFQNLRVLDLRHYAGGAFSTTTLDLRSSPEPSLPYVTDLILSTRQESLHAASLLTLPRLRNLTLCIALRDCQAWYKPHVPQQDLRNFISKHGHSLITVDLPSPAPRLEPEPDTSHFRHAVEHVKPDVFLETGACPNLISIVFPVTSEPLASLVHPNLRKIGLRGIKSENIYPDKSMNATKEHLNAITPKLYPRLEEVRTVGYLVDADSDGLIKDVFIWWVEKFESLGIDFLDGEGVLWAYSESNSGTRGENEPVKALINEAQVSQVTKMPCRFTFKHNLLTC